MVRLLVLAALGALMTAVAGAMPARAADPAPAPCTSMLYKDATADENTGPDAVIGQSPPNRVGQDPYADITGVFLNYATGADGKPVLTGNIQLKDLTGGVATPPNSYDGKVEYILEFGNIGKVDWVRAVTDGDTWTFDYGEIFDARIPDGFLRFQNKETTGRIFPGPGGVVQIDFPADPEVKPGAEMPGVHAYTGVWTSTIDGHSAFWFYSDRAPDASADDLDYGVKDCPVTPTAATTGEAPVVTETAAAPAPVQAAPAAPALTALPFKASSRLGSAKKARKARRLTAKVSATQPISGLKLTLKKGSKTVARGTLAQLTGSGTVKMKLATRKLKAGRYTLVAAGTVGGVSLTASQPVKLKK